MGPLKRGEDRRARARTIIGGILVAGSLADTEQRTRPRIAHGTGDRLFGAWTVTLIQSTAAVGGIAHPGAAPLVRSTGDMARDGLITDMEPSLVCRLPYRLRTGAAAGAAVGYGL